MPPSAVTRYLCAGAYLDDDFARAVLDEVVSDPHRGVAPAPGVDVETVARHCLAAVRRSIRRDVVICVILLAIAVTAGLRGILVVAWLCSTILLVRAVRRLSLADVSAAVTAFLIFLLVSAACAGGLVLLAARQDSSQGPLPGIGSLSLPGLIGLGLLVLWATTYLDAVGRYGVLNEKLSPSRFAPDPGFPVMRPDAQDRYAYLGEAQASALSIYSPSAPNGAFVGLGEIIHTWTAAAQLKGGDGSALTAPDVYGRVQDAGRTLAEARARDLAGGEVHLAPLVAAPGWIPVTHPFVDPVHQRPAASIPATVLADLASKPAGAETYYATIQIPVRPGDVTVTGLVHCDVSAGRLNLDVALCALPAVDPAFRSVDSVPPSTGLALLRLLGSSAADVVRVVPRAPVQLLRAARRASVTRVGGFGREVTDLGARVGVRELASGSGGLNSAADFEATRLVNLVSRAVVDAAAELLEDRGFDPEEFVDGANKVSQRPPAGARSAALGGVGS